MGAKKITTEEARKIKQMHEWGLTKKQIAELVGRDPSSVGNIVEGRWEQKKAYFRQQNELRRAAQEQPEEAPEAPVEVPEVPQERPEWAKDERLLMRLADSTDYTNALLNGILKRLMDICDALGVSGDGK